MRKGSANAYCKQIIKDLDRIPIYPPTVTRMLGDIIQFKRRRVLRTKPLGSHALITNLKNLKVKFKIRKDIHPAPFKYGSRGVNTNYLNLEGKVSNKITGKLRVSFKNKYSTYLIATDCVTHSIENLNDLNALLKPFYNKSGIDWENCFIVNSITIAKKAFILQVTNSDSIVELEGKVEGLKPSELQSSIDANLDFNITNDVGSELLIDKAKDINIFFGLVRFKKVKNGQLVYDPISSKYTFMNSKKPLNDEFELQPYVYDFEEIEVVNS